MPITQKKSALPILWMMLILASVGASAAEPQAPVNDPARWYTPDTTPQARYQTARKEAAAALEEARKTCHAMVAAERNDCLKDAQATFTRDMADAKSILQR